MLLFIKDESGKYLISGRGGSEPGCFVLFLKVEEAYIMRARPPRDVVDDDVDEWKDGWIGGWTGGTGRMGERERTVRS